MRSLLSVVLTAPVAAWTACTGARSHAAEFAITVDPILSDAVTDARQRATLRQPLLEWALKVGYLVDAYARLAGLSPRNHVAVLCGAVGRLYDDLLDETTRPDLSVRLTSLFRDDDFFASDDLERLLAALYAEIRERLERERSDPVFRALVKLHVYQQMSDLQRDPDIPPTLLDEITSHKGALTIEVLYSMVREDMSARERGLVHRVGGTLQLLDDYQDAQADRQDGLTTRATRGELNWRGVWQELGQLQRELAGYYDRRRAARFVSEMRILLCLTAIGRWRRNAGNGEARTPAIENGDTAPLHLLLRRGSKLSLDWPAAPPAVRAESLTMPGGLGRKRIRSGHPE